MSKTVELKIYQCTICGGTLSQIGDGLWECDYCHRTFKDESIKREAEDLVRAILDTKQQEQISNLRRTLYDAINAEYTDSDEIVRICGEIKALLPDDFMASFYAVANSDNDKATAKAICDIDVKKDGEYVEDVLNFMIKSFRSEFHIPLVGLIEQAYSKTDKTRFEYYHTLVQEAAEKEDKGIYETALLRDAFVAYSSYDMAAVNELVSRLEESSISCFVAARNLRHGKGAVQNYQKAINEAMSNCTCFIFVSTPSSRNFSCDALRIELPHLKKLDIENAPPKYRQNYASIPEEYKKPRIEYRLIESESKTAGDIFVKDIFNGYEYAYSTDEVVSRVIDILTSVPTFTEEPESPAETEKPAVKYCTSCGAENPPAMNFCGKCGNNSFVDTYTEYELTKKLAEMNTKIKAEEAKAAEEARKAAAAKAAEEARKAAEAKAAEEARRVAEAKAAEEARKREEARRAEEAKRAEEARKAAAAKAAERARKAAEAKAAEEARKAAAAKAAEEARKAAAAKAAEEARRAAEAKAAEEARRAAAAKAAEEARKAELERIFEFTLLDDNTYSVGVKSIDVCPENVVFPSEYNGKKVTEIAKKALKGSYSNENKTVKSITIPSSVTRIGYYAFWVCSSLTSITIPSSVTHIGDYAFSWCKALTSITIPKSVTQICGYTFYECSSLTNITIPSSVTQIGGYAFSDCSSLTSITIPSSVTHVGVYAFYKCSSLKSITIPNSVTHIGESAFEECSSLTSITIPSSVTQIGDCAFSLCKALTSITIPSSVTHIATGAFWGCSSLTSITIPNSVTQIGNKAFRHCSSLTSITIPSSITHIGTAAFYNCKALTSITFDGTKEEWDKIKKDKAEIPSSAAVKFTKKSEAEIRAERRQRGVCQHCGGTFTGLFSKKCSVCGKPKDF